MKRQTQNGFTMIELLVTVTIAAILATVALPAMGDFIKNARVTASVNDFIGAITITRSEAAKRRSPVTLCASANPLAAAPGCDAAASASWEKGWIVFADADGDVVVDAGEEILQQQGPVESSISIAPDATFTRYVSFSGKGETRDTANNSVTGNIIFCDDRGIAETNDGNSAARRLNISRTGRPQSMRKQTDVLVPGITCP